MTVETHFFNATLAAEVGIAGAVVLGNLAYLQLQHEYAGHSPFEYEGRWYVRHSYESLQQWHSYLSIDQLKRLMARLEAGGYVTKSHLGKPFDRTLYWSVSQVIADSAKSHYASGVIARSDSAKSHDVQQTNNKRQSKPKTPIPEDFCISDAVRSWAEKNGYRRLNTHLENFIDAANQYGLRYADWDAGFRTAIRKNWAGVQ